MELALFATMVALAYIALFSRRYTPLYLWFAIYIVYSLFVRIRPPFADIVNYADAFHSWPPPMLFYVFREPVIWIGAPLLRRIVGSDIVTFLALDIIMGAIVFWSMRHSRSRDGTLLRLAPTIATSYIFLLGQQNILRQHVAFVLFLWATASEYRSKAKPFILLSLSVLSHNTTLVLLGYWSDRHQRQGRPLVGYLITFSGVLALSFLVSVLGKSSIETGLDTRFLYLLVGWAVLLIIAYANVGRRFLFLCPALSNFLAFTPAMMILASAPFERIAMMFLVLIVVDIYRNHSDLRLTRGLAAHIAYIALVLPVFVFPNALQFLLQ